jgi:hypothetical protein
MENKALFATYAVIAILILVVTVSAQGVQPYPDAITNRLIYQETPMAPPSKNVVFTDPDFGSSMVRATDATTNFKLPGTYLRTSASGEGNEWSADTSKFWVTGAGGQVFAFGFSPSTMAITSLPNAGSGQGLLIPLREGASFSSVDPDLIYGTTNQAPLTITSYRFSTGASTTVIDTRTCGVQPSLGSGPSVVSDDDVSLSADDSRLSISEGGPDSGADMFIVAYDTTLGCRWYNTQTGQIGGQWGTTGLASVSTPYLVRHAYLSKSGNYVVIKVNWFGWYVWDLSTLNVTACALGSSMDCGGYGAKGYDSYINGPALLDDMQAVKRPMSNLAQTTSLFNPLPSPGNWGQVQHFTWANVDATDSTPVCGTTYTYAYEWNAWIDQPFAGEIFCIETDGLASTVWRFAHNRATFIEPFFQTQPSGSVSLDGRFFLFTSDWDAQLGTDTDGQPLSDVFIVKLD